jgi:LytS/YehU family sensor histidine kinase
MNPHFLFNALNTVHILTKRDPDMADRAVMLLAESYRFIIERSAEQMVSFLDEWSFVTSYINFEAIRFGDMLRINHSIIGRFEDVRIPPLSIQPLVENALKHGLRDKIGTGNLSVTATRTGSFIMVEISDDGLGLRCKDPYSGTLGNIRKRMHHFYPNSKLVIENRSCGGVTSHVQFDIWDLRRNAIKKRKKAKIIKIEKLYNGDDAV